ncbi:MAG TPA: c-type cytochrome [Bryobacteraceae bacterium]|nr:c-type cytochrome [Bryobacteraceae bacterium]
MLRLLGFLCATALVTCAAELDQLAYGKYLVEEVAKCQDCHTPRGDSGKFDAGKWLKGATLDFEPTHETKGWHQTSPDITSSSRLFARWGEQGLIKFLETGTGPGGHPADPPMPAYKLKTADAEAIVAYLKSLK